MPASTELNAKIAVLGLGTMGSRIANRLCECGYQVIGWNRTPDKQFPKLTIVSTIPEAVNLADIIMISVTDSIAVEEIVTQFPSKSSNQTTIIMDMSTIGPESARSIAFSMEEPYIYLDSPVLGTTTEANEGTLKVLLGGTPDDATFVISVLGDSLGEIIHVGGIGSGSAAKLVANFSLLAAVVSFGEAYSMGAALGLESSTLQGIISTGPLGSQVDRRIPAILDGRFEKRFSLDLALKDTSLIVKQPQLLDKELYITKGIQDWLSLAVDSGNGQLDYTAVLATILGTLARPD
ncbi:MAG: NAD(P)-dependent oxidoreductase [bacterium]|nr:NAD(P)-dependent oxidoreductase [bacterium]